MTKLIAAIVAGMFSVAAMGVYAGEAAPKDEKSDMKKKDKKDEKKDEKK